MPTYEVLASFLNDIKHLRPDQRRDFEAAVNAFVEDLRRGQGFRAALRVKKMAGHNRIWELSWAPDGRATFEYGPSKRANQPHVIWRRVETHRIFTRP